MKLTGNDLAELLEGPLRDALVNATGSDREEYVRWAADMAPMIVQYSSRLAAGDRHAGDMLDIIVGTGEGKLWDLVNKEELAVSEGVQAAIKASVTTAGKLVADLILKYGLVVLAAI